MTIRENILDALGLGSENLLQLKNYFDFFGKSINEEELKLELSAMYEEGLVHILSQSSRKAELTDIGSCSFGLSAMGKLAWSQIEDIVDLTIIE